jgi:hypothetical protein
MVGVTHVEGDVTANFTISPLQGTGVVYREGGVPLMVEKQAGAGS